MIICLKNYFFHKWQNNQLYEKKTQNICQKAPDYSSTDKILTDSGFN
jgi:hypothetical protein